MEGAPVQSNGKPTAALDKDAPWVEKYRPRTLDDVAAHKEIVDTSAQRVSLLLNSVSSMRSRTLDKVASTHLAQSSGW